jgi:hypothetical protein
MYDMRYNRLNFRCHLTWFSVTVQPCLSIGAFLGPNGASGCFRRYLNVAFWYARFCSMTLLSRERRIYYGVGMMNLGWVIGY